MELNFQTYGQGPALLILHGLFGSLDNWTSHARKLSEHFSVYTIDQRNHGKSPHSDEWNYEVMADDLVQFMDQHGIIQAHLLGHSMGGKTVMQVAGTYPERIDKLIVADMAPKSYQPHHTQLIDALLSVELAKFDQRKEIAEYLATKIPDAGVRQFLLKGLGRDEHKKLRWKFNLKIISEKYADVLKNISMEEIFDKPALFVYGENSSYVDNSDFPDILSCFSKATFEMLPKTGHWIHAESPRAFLQSVMNFLL